MNRFRAAALHLLSSALVLLLVFLLIQQVWYPGKLFTLAAGADLLKLIIGVDLIIGPLVMLIIFDAKKKLIKLDVAIVLLLQVAFMGYGLWTMFAARPAFYVFAQDHFYLVRANEIEDKDLKLSRFREFQSIPLFGPEYVGTKQPADIKLRNDIAFGSLAGLGIQNLPQYFVPYEQVLQEVKSSGKTSQKLMVDFEVKARVTSYEKTHSARPVLFLPMVNKHTPLIVVVDATTAQIVEII